METILLYIYRISPGGIICVYVYFARRACDHATFQVCADDEDDEMVGNAAADRSPYTGIHAVRLSKRLTIFCGFLLILLQ